MLREDGTLLSACEELLASLWDDPLSFPPPSSTPSTTTVIPPSQHPRPPLPTISPDEVTNTPPSSSPTQTSNDDLISSLSVDPLPPPPPEAAVPLTPSPTPSPDQTAPGVSPPAHVVDVLPYYPALLRLAVLPTVADESIVKRLVTCMLASLRAKGTSFFWGTLFHKKKIVTKKTLFTLLVVLKHFVETPLVCYYYYYFFEGLYFTKEKKNLWQKNFIYFVSCIETLCWNTFGLLFFFEVATLFYKKKRRKLWHKKTLFTLLVVLKHFVRNSVFYLVSRHLFATFNWLQ